MMVNVWTVGKTNGSPKEKALASQYCYLEECFDQFIRYLKNNNGLVKSRHFIEDFDPIGEKVIADMQEAGIAKRMVDKRNNIDDLMLIDFDTWSLWQ